MDVMELDIELSSVLSKLKKNISYYDSVIEETSKLQSEYINKAELMDKLIKSSNSEVLKIVKRGDEVNTLKEEINKRIKEISNSIIDKEKDIKDLTNNIKDIMDKADNLDEMIVSEEQDYKELMIILRNKNDEFINELQGNIDNIHNKVKELDEVLTEKQLYYKELTASLSSNNDKFIEKLENYINEFNSIKKEYSEIRQAFENNKQSIKESKEIVNTVIDKDTKELTNIIEKRTEIIEECDLAVKNIEKKKLEVDEFKKSLQEEVNDSIKNQESKISESISKQIETINKMKAEYDKKIRIASIIAVLGIILGIIGVIF